MCNIPLLDIPLEILRKYADYPACKKKGVLLPVPCNQKMNSYLKELACNVDSGSGGAYFIDRYFRIHVDFRFLIEYPDIARIDPCDRYCGG